jgi:hypothetical protein
MRMRPLFFLGLSGVGLIAAACGLDKTQSAPAECGEGSAPACDASPGPLPTSTGAPDTTPPQVDAAPPPPPAGPFVGTAYIEDHATLNLPSDGDLWPSCWSNDDALYAANGDGKAFGDNSVDVAVSRITGSPPALAGETLARSSDVGQVWTAGNYNRKPTGMLCQNGDLYLAVQDLSFDFMDVPAATIAVSHDHGSTWSWNHDAPMFSDHVMTTLMFLDFGKDSANAIDDFVYVYAIDENWRFSTSRPSPTKLWLARTPKDKVQDRSAWTYFTGLGADGAPGWTADVSKRAPVLDEPEKVYTKAFFSTGARDMTIISQGSIVYDAPLKRYLYTAWTEYTFEFYEAPSPWGPWKRFLSRDYGPYPWNNDIHGGYATTIPSKFISADGKSMLVQSNTFMGGITNYELSFRKLFVEPLEHTPIANAKGDENLAREEKGGVPISRGGHAGASALLNDGAITDSIDSWTDEEKTEDYWGVVWAKPRTVDTISYTTGKMFDDGGWFTSIRAQVRVEGAWVDVASAAWAPPYPGTTDAGDNATYVVTFAPVVVDGVRVIGTPGGSKTFTSAAEISAQYK